MEKPAAPTPTPAGDAASFCIEKLATVEPSQYYSALFVARDKRAALMSAYAFWLEVREIIDECREPEVARVKLGWWHEEIHEAAAGRPRHPVSVALSPVLNAHPLFIKTLLAVIEELRRHALGAAYTSYAELHDYGIKTRGAIEQLAVSIMGATALDNAAKLGALVELTWLLRDTGLSARRARCHLPSEDLARFGVDAHDLYAGRANEAIDQLIKFHASRLRGELQQQMVRVPAAARAPLTPVLTAAAVSDATLANIADAGGRILRERPTLSPLRQLWIAWRSARRAAR